MTKYKLLILITFFINGFLFSQSNSDFGIKLGVNVSSTNVDILGSTADLTIPKSSGLLFGVYHDYNFNSSFGINTNFVFNNKKVNFSNDKYIISLNYLDINPMIKFDVNKSYGKGFYLKSGLRYSFLISAKEDESKLDVKEVFNNSNTGLLFAFGSSLLNYFEIEWVLDYSINDALKDVKSNLFSASVIINIDVNRIFNKN